MAKSGETKKWESSRNLYLDWRTPGLVCAIFGAIFAGICLFVLALTGFEDAGKICGGFALLAGFFMLLIILGSLIVAWAKGGVEEWEYEMDTSRIKARRIIRHPGRMKFLRGAAAFMTLFATKPGQATAMKGLMHDMEEKAFDVKFASVTNVKSDPKKGEVILETRNNARTLRIGEDDFEKVLDFIKKQTAQKKRRTAK